MSVEPYTYRGGKKVTLENEPDQFVVRTLPEELQKMSIADAEQVSSGLSRNMVRATDVKPTRELAGVSNLGRWSVKILRDITR